MNNETHTLLPYHHSWVVWQSDSSVAVWSCLLFSVDSPFTSCHFSLSDSISAPECRCPVQSFALFSPSTRGHQCSRQNRLSIMGWKGETHKQCNLDTRPYDSRRRAMLLLFAVSWHNLFSTCFTSYPTVFSSLLPSLCDIPWLFSFSCYTVVLLPVLLSLRLMLPSGIGESMTFYNLSEPLHQNMYHILKYTANAADKGWKDY